MTRVFLSIYYLLLSIVIFYDASLILFKDFSNETNFIWLARVFSILPISKVTVLLIYLVTIFLSILCTVKPKRLFRLLAAIFFILSFSLLLSFGKIYHSAHVWLISSVLICFINLDNNLRSIHNSRVILIIRSVLLTHYVSSGIWKLRNLKHVNINYFSELAHDSIAYGYLEGSKSSEIVRLFFQESPKLAGIGLMIVIFFQLSCVIPIITKKYFVFFGFAICSFHLMNGLVLGIFFTPTIFGILFFFITTEVMLNTELSLKSDTLSKEIKS